MTHGLGWRPDLPDARDYSFAANHASAPMPTGEVSLMQYAPTPWDQDGVSACVGFAVARAIHVRLLAAGDSSAPMPSPAFLYYNSRAAEYDPPIEDDGTFPRLAMQACRAMGFCRESDWPFDPNRRNDRPELRCYRRAFDQRDLSFYRIDSTGPERIADLRVALSLGYPVIFGMLVDSAFQRHRGDTPISSISEFDIVGGHMMTALGHSDRGVAICNSWGADWGDGGNCIMTDELFGGHLLGDVYAVRAALPFSE